MAQLTRPASEISRSAGTWILSSGTDISLMLDETLSDGTTTEVATPSTVATHTVEVKFGTNWDGKALARPASNANAILRVDLRYVTAAVDVTVYLMEGATIRDTWVVGTLPGSTYSYFRRALSTAVIDSITDFTDLRVRVAFTVGTSGRRGAITYASLIMGDVAGNRRGIYTLDPTGLSAMPTCWEQYSSTSAVLAPITVGSNRIDAVDALGVRILTCYAIDLPADCYAEVRAAASYDINDVFIGAFVRQAKAWVTPGTDSVRYDMVPNPLAGTPAWELKYDGGASSVEDSEPFTNKAAPVGGDRMDTRAVGSAISGRKNDEEITADTDTQITAAGYCGIVIAGVAAPWLGIDRFVMASVPLVNPRLLPSRRRRSRSR